MRACKRCEGVLLYCRSREPGRRYCGDCSGPAQKERERKARKKYRSRDYGREQHCDEEAERRERIRLGRDGVGDRRCGEEQGGLQVCTATAAVEVGVPQDSDALPRGKTKAVEWILVAGRGLLGAATRLMGTQQACPCCGRVGPVVEVMGLDAWRRARRRRDYG